MSLIDPDELQQYPYVENTCVSRVCRRKQTGFLANQKKVRELIFFFIEYQNIYY